MTREELIKLAALDVYGLLDEIESEMYARSLREASAAIQDEIIALQARWAVDPMFFSLEEPSSALREKVIDRVMEAIQQEQVELAPLATIGRNRSGKAANVSADGTVKRASSSGSLLFWRAASFMLLASLVVVLYMYSDAVRAGRDIGALALQKQSEEQLRRLIGPDFEDFLANPNVHHVVFKPAETTVPGQATMYINEATNSVFVNTMGLRNGSYTVRVRYEDGSVQELRDFNVTPSRLASIRLDSLAKTVLAAASWEIVERGSGLVVLAT